MGALPAVLYEVHGGAAVYGEDCPASVSARLLLNSGLYLTKTRDTLSYCYHFSFLFQESALKANRFSQSVKVVHDRLHLQIQKREAENDKLKEHVKVMNTHFIVSVIE